MDIGLTFGAWLRRRRRLLDLTQKELARQVGCAVVTIRKFEADDRKPSKELAERLAACLKLFPEEYDEFIAFARSEPYLDQISPPDVPSTPSPWSPIPTPGLTTQSTPLPDPAREQQIRFCTSPGGIRIAYATVGQGPPLVKVANWLSHLEYDWRSPVWRHWLEGLSNRHTLVRYDERGCGLSDWDIEDFSIDAWVRDLETVVETVGLDRFPLLGMSQGGPIAIAYAVRHPEKVSHLILYGTFARGWIKRNPPLEEVEEIETWLKLIKVGWGRENPAFRQVFAGYFLPEGTPEQISWFTDLQRLSTSTENAIRFSNAFWDIDVSDLATRVAVPTLVLHARDDASAPFDEGRQLAALIPNAQLVSLESKNHILLEDEPAWSQFLAEVYKFLGTSGWHNQTTVGTLNPILNVTTPPFFEQTDELSEVEQPIFVAREAELAQLNAFLDAALAGQGRIAFVTGEAGSGKTALVKEFARQACRQQAGLIVAGGNCNAYGGPGDPYLPFREILELLTGGVETCCVVGMRRQRRTCRLWELMPQAVRTLVEVGPDLVDTFISGKALAARAAGAAPLGADWPAGLRALLAEKATAQNSANLQQSDFFAQYARFLQRLAQRQPLLLLLDDLQWADAGSINLLFHLGRQLPGQQILLVGAYRPGEVALGRAGERHPLEPVTHEFQRYFGHVQVDLARSAGRPFVDALLDSRPNRLRSGFRQTLYNLTKGHALFTVEILRSMQARGDLVRDETGHWVKGPGLDWNILPARIEGIIAERVDRLPPDLRAILEVAAVEGEDFTAEVVARAQGIEQWRVVQGLSGREGSRLANNQGSRRVGAGRQRVSGYRFRHILFQRYLYSSLDETKRSYLHEAVGNALEYFYEGRTDAVVAQLARHFQAAGLMGKAVDYLLQAGQSAARMSAHQEAIAHFEKGLSLLESLPAGPECNRQELLLQIALGNILIPVKGYGSPDVAQAYTRAWLLCRQAGESPELFPAMYGLWVFKYVRAELQAALELAHQFLRLVQRGPAKEPLPVAHHMMGITMFNLGEIPAAAEHLEQCVALYNRRSPHLPALDYGQDPKITALSHLALSLWLLGYPQKALKKINRAINLARNHPQPYNMAFAQTFAAIFHQFCRNGRAVQKKAAAAVELSDQHGFVVWATVGAGLRGWSLAQLGRQEQGLAQMDDAFAKLQTIGSEIFRPYFLALLAETYAQAGNVGQALTILNQALTIAGQSGDRFWEAELHRLMGELLPNSEKAEAGFVKAVKTAHRQGAKSLELRAATSLYRLWQGREKQKDAHLMLAEIYSRFTEGADTPDLIEAAILLEA